jgi:pimeloyl-ACP methyl ester carboxylesterase
LIVLMLGMLAAASGASRTTTAPDGVSLRYEMRGQGEPTLVFVHCWSCDRHLWDDAVARFTPKRRVVTLDLAGHGESGRDRKDWTIQAFGADVAAVVKAEALERVVLVGHSMGGLVMLETARLLPGQVAGMVPVDTLSNVEERMTPQMVEDVLGNFRADFKTAAERFMRDHMVEPGTDKALVERLVAQVRAAPEPIAVAALRSAWLYDPVPTLDTLRVPVVAINGDKFPTNIDGNRRHAPGYRVLLMKGLGHYLMLEKPDEFAERLEEALGLLAAPTTSPE